jgi:hypothetical protein
MSAQRPTGEASQRERAGAEAPAARSGGPGDAGTAPRTGRPPRGAGSWRALPTPVFLGTVGALTALVFLALVAVQHWIVQRTYVITPLPPVPATVQAPTPSPVAISSPTAVPEATAAAVITSVLPAGDPLEAEISAAYREYWQVYADALYSLDATSVPSVADGPELQRILTRIDSLKSQGEAIQVNVEHLVHVVRLSGAESNIGVADKFIDRSYIIDANTKEAIHPPDASGTDALKQAQGTEENDLYIFKQVDGVWKVIGSLRIS